MAHYDFEDEEVEKNLIALYDSVDDVDSYIHSVYEELLFLGAAPGSRKDETIYFSTVLCLKLCLRYYYDNCDYDKVAKLKTLYDLLIDPKASVVSAELLDEINICLN
jgi:hypothetical protein